MSETLVRAISGAVYVAILLIAAWYSEVSFKILMGIFLVLATVEFSRLIRFTPSVGFVLAIGLYALFGFFNNFGNNPDLFITAFAALTGLWLIKKLFSSDSLVINNDIYKYLLFIGYVVFPFVIITKIPQTDGSYEPYAIISIFLLIWINDTFAYLVGKSFGKHKLLERISPKKTVEGFVGGAVFTVVTAWFLGKYYVEIFGTLHTEYRFIPGFWIVLAIIVVIFATLGDLVESKFKRSANVKDSGNIMPGHGGILDRLDSIIFVAPFVYLFYQIIDYVS
ncbi:MAG: phosphatidate cytidylyltransferase [Flavobacteriaceae bacterium]